MSVLTADGEAYQLDAYLAKLTADGKTLYAELTTTVPTKASAGTAATSIARHAIVLARTDDTLLNTLVEFGNASAIETYVGINIYDAATAGVRHMGGALTTDVTSVIGEPVQILAGAFLYSPDANV